MSFQLKSNESVSHGVKRSVRREIEKALEQLRAHGQEEEIVHEARKSFKKVRAALRLVRGELGDSVFRQENNLFRDAAQPLTEIRDAEALIETVDKLREQFASEIDAGALDKVREALVTRYQAMSQRLLKEDRVCASVADMVAPVIDRIQDWKIDHKGWSALGPGLKQVYRAGHRALSAASTDPSVENLHEWRKQAKYLWHELQLLELAWASREKDLGDEVHKLTDLLGDDHDLAVLRRTLEADPDGHGGHDVVRPLMTFIDRRRADLQRQAFDRGRQVYRDTPKAFIQWIKAGWRSSRSAAPLTLFSQPARTTVVRSGYRTPRRSRYVVRSQ